MRWLNRLEDRFCRFSIPHVTVGLIVGQAVVLIIGQTRPDLFDAIALKPDRVLAGQIWRLLAFLLEPLAYHPLLAILDWYFFWMVGMFVEAHWETFKYNFYWLVGILVTDVAALAYYYVAAIPFAMPNSFIFGSVFLAFAYLFPDFVINLAGVLPVRARWLGIAAGVWCANKLLNGDDVERVAVLAGLGNFVLFFGVEICKRAMAGDFTLRRKAPPVARESRAAFHRCTVCGITDRTHPQMDFRYCSQCQGTYGYCMDHLRNHEHVRTPGEVPS